MTLCVALITEKFAVSVTDRRLTAGTQVVGDEEDKTFSLITSDARLAVSFTGLAKADKFVTHELLMKKMVEAGPPDFTLDGILARFSHNLTTEFRSNRIIRSLPPLDRRLRILLIGFALQFPNKRICRIVANFEQPNNASAPSGAMDEFEYVEYGFSDQRPIDAFKIGNTSALKDELIADLKKVTIETSARVITKKIVRLISKTAQDNTARGSIGQQLTSICIQSDPSSMIERDYHVAKVNENVHFPAHVNVTPNMPVTIAMRIEPGIPENSPISVPTVGRNKMCPCGSRKRYKNCHGLRGSITSSVSLL